MESPLPVECPQRGSTDDAEEDERHEEFYQGGATRCMAVRA